MKKTLIIFFFIQVLQICKYILFFIESYFHGNLPILSYVTLTHFIHYIIKLVTFNVFIKMNYCPPFCHDTV